MCLFVCPDCDVLVKDLEIVPLGVSLCVKIVFEPEVVLDVVDFGSFAEVAVLET